MIVGDRRQLFHRSDHATGLQLIDVTTTPPGLALHTYTVDGPATFDTYDPAAHTFPDEH